MGIQTLQKTWENNGAMSLCVPKKVQVALGIEAGDLIQITWENVIKISKEDKAKLKRPSKGEGIKPNKIRELPSL